MDILNVTLKAVLNADTTLKTYMTAGAFDSLDFPDGLSYEVAPKMGVDDLRIKPFINIVYTSRIPDPTQPDVLPFERDFVEFWFYHYSAYTSIKAAILRVKELMHRQYFRTSDTSLLKALWAGDIGEFRDDALNKACADRSRYSLEILRNL